MFLALEIAAVINNSESIQSGQGNISQLSEATSESSGLNLPPTGNKILRSAMGIETVSTGVWGPVSQAH